MQTIQQFCDTHGITMSVTRIQSRTDHSTEWDKSARHWRCVLTRDKTPCMTVEFLQGSAYKDPPSVYDVLDCLASDAPCVIGQTFDQFCGELGYDTDSRRAERLYHACQETARDLMAFLPAGELDTLLYDTERM